MMAQSRAKSTRDTFNYGQYINQFPRIGQEIDWQRKRASNKSWQQPPHKTPTVAMPPLSLKSLEKQKKPLQRCSQKLGLSCSLYDEVNQFLPLLSGLTFLK